MSLKDWTTGEITFILHEDNTPCWSHSHIRGSFTFTRELKDAALNVEDLIRDSCWRLAEDAFGKAARGQ